MLNAPTYYISSTSRAFTWYDASYFIIIRTNVVKENSKHKAKNLPPLGIDGNQTFLELQNGSEYCEQCNPRSSTFELITGLTVDR